MSFLMLLIQSEHVNEEAPRNAMQATRSSNCRLTIRQADSHALHAGNNNPHIHVRNSFTGTLMGA